MLLCRLLLSIFFPPKMEKDSTRLFSLNPRRQKTKLLQNTRSSDHTEVSFSAGFCSLKSRPEKRIETFVRQQSTTRWKACSYATNSETGKEPSPNRHIRSVAVGIERKNERVASKLLAFIEKPDGSYAIPKSDGLGRESDGRIKTGAAELRVKNFDNGKT